MNRLSDTLRGVTGNLLALVLVSVAGLKEVRGETISDGFMALVVVAVGAYFATRLPTLLGREGGREGGGETERQEREQVLKQIDFARRTASAEAYMVKTNVRRLERKLEELPDLLQQARDRQSGDVPVTDPPRRGQRL